MFLLNMQKLLLKISYGRSPYLTGGPKPHLCIFLPNIWFRNTWDWGYSPDKPSLERLTDDSIFIQHKILGKRWLYAENPDELLFCDNESNSEKLY